MNKLLAIALAAVMLVSAFAVAAGAETEFKGTVNIGHLAVTTGADDYLGVPTTYAMQDYIDEINAKGGWLGYKVNLVTYDIARGVEEVAPATTKLIDEDDCIAILGPTYSAGATAAQPVVTEAGVPLIALSATSAKVTVDENTGEVYDWMFRVCFTDDYQSDGLANFLWDEGITKVGILNCVTNAYSVGMVDLFTQIYEGLGGEVTKVESFYENDVDFRAQLTNIGDSDCEAIFMPAPNIRYGVLAAQQARELGIEVPFALPDSVYGAELLEAAEELEGSWISTGLIDDDPAYEEYRAAFKEKHGVNANMFCYYGLDALMLLEDAVMAANSVESAAIRDALETMTDAPAFTENITIDPETHNPLNKSVTLMTIHDGNYELYKVFDPKAN